MAPLAAGVSQIQVTLDSRVYSLGAIKKAAYRFLNRFAADVRLEGDAVLCTLNFPDPQTPEQKESVVHEFLKEVLDQDLREHIRTETEPVRNLILAYAFSKTGIEPDE